MSVDKKINYDVQGGVKNYLGKQKEVKAPLKWQSSPDHPTTELAYITEAEKDLLVKSDLHGSLKGGVNRGPSGIMSLNGWGSADPGQNVSGAAASAAESGGGGNARDRAEVAASGMSAKDVQDFRSAAINAGAGQRTNAGFFDSKNVISPAEVAMAKAARNNPNNRFGKAAFNETRGGAFGNFISGGGITGGIIKGLGQMFGLGKKYNEPTSDMSGFSGLGLGGTGQEGFGVPTQQGDYDVLGNKINEITGEIVSPNGQSFGFIDGYPGKPTNTTTVNTGGEGNRSRGILDVIQKYVPTDVELNDGAFESRFLQNRTLEEKEAIEKMINEKFKYNYEDI